MVGTGSKTIVVGQKVHSILYGGRDGIVIAVHGEQVPDRVDSLGGVVTWCDTANFDIAFESYISKGIPESIIHGVQWFIDDEVATPDEIATAIANAEAATAAAKVKQSENLVRREAEKAKHAADNPHLVTKATHPDWSPSRLAAENIRRELKRAFPTVKFAVSKDGYDAVRVKWTDGPTVKMVEAVTRKYSGGSFDGSQDLFEYNPDATFAAVFGDPKYVFESREWTTEGVRKAWVNGKSWGVAEDVGEEWYSRSDDRSDMIRRTWSETNLI
jgi:hypothetical protein